MSAAEVTVGYVGPDCNGMLMTPEEFDAIEEYDELYCYELIHGVLIVLPRPGEAERSPNDELGHLIRNYQEGHTNGGIVDDTMYEQTLYTTGNRRAADRAIWLGLGRAPDPRRDVPAILVEFVSKRRRDRNRDYVEKRREYAEAGVKEYWVIDRRLRRMTVYRGTGEEIVVGGRQTYRTDLMPGFELPLERLLMRADRYPDS
jgi:Uma2 family endonuclease